MGVLPLQFVGGQTRQSLGLTGHEALSIHGVAEGIEPRKKLTVHATRADGSSFDFDVRLRIDTPIEIDYYRHGGILNYVLRLMLREGEAAATAG
jgi:aconitate hydratase